MSIAEILEELPRLKPEERHEVLERIYQIEKISEDEWLDADDPLTEAEKVLIDSRIAAHERNPEAAIPWEQFDARLKRRLGE
jgi:putative addiction module component (TIGR02574 family)